MKLIIYGIIIGFGKIIPGISGSLLAISLGVYQQAIHAVTHFFDNPKENIHYIIKLSIGIILGIILFSRIILYLINNYYFYSILLFLGLIISTIIKHYKNIIINKKVLIIIILLVLFLYKIPNIKLNGDNPITYILGGFIEVFSSLIPGISGTSIFMSLGIYNNILELITHLLDITYIQNNFINYLNYFLGIFISFIGCTLLIDYLYQNHKSLFDNIVLGLSIGSIITIITLINWPYNIFNIIVGVFLFAVGTFIGLII